MNKPISMTCYASKKGYVLALCDTNRLGKVYSEHTNDDLVCLDLKLYSRFYNSDDSILVDQKDVIDFIRRNKIHTINAVGEKSVSALVTLGIVSEDEIIYISDVPHAQVFYIRKKD